MTIVDALDSLYQNLGTTGQDVFKATVGPTVAILTFAATNLLQVYVNSRNRRSDTKHVLIGIYKEVMDNFDYAEHNELTNAVKDTIKVRIVEEHTRALTTNALSNYRPLVSISESSSFYNAVSAKIPGIKACCLIRITDYYRSVMDQKRIGAAVAGDAFLCITVESRCEMIDELWIAFEKSSIKAKSCLARLNEIYPRSWFKRLRLDDVGTGQGELLFFRETI